MVNYPVVANGPKDHIILYFLPLFITSFVLMVQHTKCLLHTRYTKHIWMQAQNSPTCTMRFMWLRIDGIATSNQHSSSTKKCDDTQHISVSFGSLFSIRQINRTEVFFVRILLEDMHSIRHASLWFDNDFFCEMLVCAFATGFYCLFETVNQ